MVELDHHARRLMACLGDNSRFRIAQTLAGGEICVSDLARRVELSQSCTTRHLQALGRDGLVLRRRAGKRVLFRLNMEDERLKSLLDWAAGGSVQDPGARPVQRRRAGSAARSTAAAAPKDATPPAGREDAATPTEVEPPPAAPPSRRGDLEDYLL